MKNQDQAEFFAKIYEADGEKTIIGALGFSEMQEWVNTEGCKTEFEVLRRERDELIESTAIFTRNRIFLQAKQKHEASAQATGRSF